jgi:hypothetical protein
MFKEQSRQARICTKTGQTVSSKSRFAPNRSIYDISPTITITYSANAPLYTAFILVQNRLEIIFQPIKRPRTQEQDYRAVTPIQTDPHGTI